MFLGIIVAALISFTGGVATTTNVPEVAKFGQTYLGKDVVNK